MTYEPNEIIETIHMTEVEHFNIASFLRKQESRLLNSTANRESWIPAFGPVDKALILGDWLTISSNAA